MMLTNFEVIQYVKTCNTVYVYMSFHCLIIELCYPPHIQRLIAYNIFSESNKKKISGFASDCRAREDYCSGINACETPSTG